MPRVAPCFKLWPFSSRYNYTAGLLTYPALLACLPNPCLNGPVAYFLPKGLPFLKRAGDYSGGTATDFHSLPFADIS